MEASGREHDFKAYRQDLYPMLHPRTVARHAVSSTLTVYCEEPVPHAFNANNWSKRKPQCPLPQS